MRLCRSVAFSVVVFLVPGVDVASGQDVGGAAADALVTVDSLAHSGRTEEARELLLTWWDGERSAASRAEIEHGTWLRALLTVDPEQARVEYRRLEVEFPGGRYVAPALVRIARLLEAAGDTTGARETWETLIREHPGSEESEWAQRRLTPS